MSYETLVPADVVVMDPSGKVIEGARRPSVDTVALLHIFNNMPAVNAIIHTHQPYATAVGLVMDKLPAFCTTLVNATLGAVTVAPYSNAASLDMGLRTVEYIGDKRAVILKHHGVVTVGPTVKDALHAAVYLEDACRCYCAARAMGTPAVLTPPQVAEAIENRPALRAGQEVAVDRGSSLPPRRFGGASTRRPCPKGLTWSERLAAAAAAPATSWWKFRSTRATSGCRGCQWPRQTRQGPPPGARAMRRHPSTRCASAPSRKYARWAARTRARRTRR